MISNPNAEIQYPGQSIRKEGFATSRGSKEKDPPGWLDAGVHVDFGVFEGHHDQLEDFLNTVIDATQVSQ
jgi:hypothetical protein